MTYLYINPERLPIVQDCLMMLPDLFVEVNKNILHFTHATDIDGFNNLRDVDQTYELETPGWHQIYLKWGSLEENLDSRQASMFLSVIERNKLLCPTANSILMKYSQYIDAFGYSLIQPGTYIHPHIDLDDDVRIHICIVEDYECKLYFDDTSYALRNGEVLAFDGSYRHSLIHNGIHDRIHLLFDLKREYAEQYIHKIN